ncbi:MAG: Transcriptional regulator, WhiB family, partial [uncultured Blastococcus sp.]
CSERSTARRPTAGPGSPGPRASHPGDRPRWRPRRCGGRCPAGWRTPNCGSPRARQRSSRPRACAATARSGRPAWQAPWTGPSRGASGAARSSNGAPSSPGSARVGGPARSSPR